MVIKDSKRNAKENFENVGQLEQRADATTDVDAANPDEEHEIDEMSAADDQAEFLAQDEDEQLAGPIALNLSSSLLNKLNRLARTEGVTKEELALELLSQGVVLRAWEAIERRSQNRNFQNGNRKNNNNRNFRHDNNKRRMSHARYHAIMDDKASFLEYVRSQDPLRRR